jgi:hypothetical protein
VLAFLAITQGQEKEIRGIHIGKKGIKLSLFADDMILYLQDTEVSTRRLLDLINIFSKVAEHKINIKFKSFLYTIIKC